jgi:hypothetical protein
MAYWTPKEKFNRADLEARQTEPVAPGAPVTIGVLLDTLDSLREMTPAERAEAFGLKKGSRVFIINDTKEG